MASSVAFGTLLLLFLVVENTAFIAEYAISRRHLVESRYNVDPVIKCKRRQNNRLTLGASTAPLALAQATLPSIALVLPIGVRNTTARGSGFVVDWQQHERVRSNDAPEHVIYLLTAAHVAIPGYRIQVVFYLDSNDNQETTVLAAKVVGRDSSSDLALLEVPIGPDFTPPPPLTISNQTKAAIGTRAYSIGYPSGGVVGPAMTSGIVCGNALGLVTSAVVDIFGDRNATNDIVNDAKTEYVVTDAAMAGGMSGGPLVDGESGAVLGLNALINMELRALGNYAISAAECISFLSRLGDDSRRSEEARNNTKSVVHRVVLYNDRFNKRERVQQLLENVAKLNSTESNRAMMDAHTKGRGIIKEFYCDNEVKAKELCDALREEDLLVELETIYC